MAAAASLLAHEGPEGADVDEFTFMAALRELRARVGPEVLAVAVDDEGDEDLARQAVEQARRAREEQMRNIEEMKRKKNGGKKP